MQEEVVIVPISKRVILGCGKFVRKVSMVCLTPWDYPGVEGGRNPGSWMGGADASHSLHPILGLERYLNAGAIYPVAADNMGLHDHALASLDIC